MARPTKYDPTIMLPIIIDLMSEGASKVEVCAELGICNDTLIEWCKDQSKPEFSEAVKHGERLSEAWWQKKGRKNLENKDFSSTLWYMNMRNRFGWADKTEQKTENTTEIKGDLTIRPSITREEWLKHYGLSD